MTIRNLLGGAAALGLTLATATARAELPTQDWTRTETRADCTSYDPLRTPFFGETHIHTSYSGDAVFVRVRTTPRDAYMFAQGDQIGLPPYDAFGAPTRSAHLRRPAARLGEDPALRQRHAASRCAFRRRRAIVFMPASSVTPGPRIGRRWRSQIQPPAASTPTSLS